MEPYKVALLSSLLTGFFTTAATFWANRHNLKVTMVSIAEHHRTTIEATRIQTVAPMKEAWKNRVRDIMAQLLASLHSTTKVTKEERTVLLYQLELLLDDRRESLISEINRAIRINGIENRSRETEQELIESVNKCCRLCFQITDDTWRDIQGKTPGSE